MDKTLKTLRRVDKLLTEAEKLLQELQGLEVKKELVQFEALVTRSLGVKALLEQREEALLEVLFRCESVVGFKDFQLTNSMTYAVVNESVAARRSFRRNGDFVPERRLNTREFREEVGVHLDSAFNCLLQHLLSFIDDSEKRSPRRLDKIKAVISALNQGL